MGVRPLNLRADQRIEDAEIKNADYARVEFKSKEIVDTTFVRCSFAEALFYDCRFKNCAFIKCDLSMMRVKSSVFSSVRFEGCKAIGINWTEASWQKGAFFRLIDFEDCALNYSSFFGLKLKKMRMTHCIAKEVDFGEADLSGAVFAFTDFSGSTFLHTDLTDADFVNAVNYTISAKLNTLKKTKFSLPEAMSLLRGLDIILVDSEEGEKKR
jgi:fluoroquinolone resistance protein